METRKFAMNYGSVLGLSLACVALVLWVLGIDESQSVIPSLLNNLLIIGFIVYAISYYRDNLNNGFISYSESLKLGTTIAFFSSVIMAFYSFIYITYLNPDLLNAVLKEMEQTVLQGDPDISEEKLDLALEMTARFTQPHWLVIMGVLSGTFMGFFYSAIVSFFVKNPDSQKIE